MCNSLFNFCPQQEYTYILLYVDVIVLTTFSVALKDKIIIALKTEFEMSDLGPFSYFLGISIKRTTNSMFLTQQKYMEETLYWANMSNSKPVATPIHTKSKLSTINGSLLTDPTLYRNLTGALQYVTFTRPYIAYSIQQICLFIHAPRDSHFNALKRVLRYLKGTLDL